MTDLQNPTQPNQTKSNTILKVISGLVIGVLLISVITIYGRQTLQQYRDIRELEQNQVKWGNQHIAHYSMSVDLPYETTYYGELPMPLTVEVKDNNVVSVTDAQGDIISAEESNNSAYYYQNFFTVPGLFAYVHQYYLERPPSIEIIYDSVFGFPGSIYIDPYTEPCCQDFQITIDDFQVLP